MKVQKLKGKLREKEKTYKDCAKVLGCSVTTVSNKMQGKIPFDCWEAEQISNWLHLTNMERVDIFLSKDLHDMQE